MNSEYIGFSSKTNRKKTIKRRNKFMKLGA